MEKLHIWTITSGQVALSAHLTVESLGAEERDKLLRQLRDRLTEKFGIHESTLEIATFNKGERP